MKITASPWFRALAAAAAGVAVVAGGTAVSSVIFAVGVAMYMLIAIGAYWHFGFAEAVRADSDKYMLLGVAALCLMWPLGVYVFYVEPRLKKAGS